MEIVEVPSLCCQQSLLVCCFRV
uniref:Uncharacterized protein n=1 Tax=Arundo donax TaxID=35708 RepID=A0A0A9C3M9_ARUDO